MRVYELTHFYEDEDGYDFVTEIGVYTSRKRAEKARDKFRMHDKFKARPNDFCIASCIVNKSYWVDGFFTYD